MSIPKACLGVIGDECAPGFNATGEYLFEPDLSTIRPCGLAFPGHINIMGFFTEKVKAAEKTDFRVTLCPRTQLLNVVE